MFMSYYQLVRNYDFGHLEWQQLAIIGSLIPLLPHKLAECQ